MLDLFSQWNELIITQDGETFMKVCASLKRAGIAYKEKIQNIGHGNRRTGQIGSLGENESHSHIYQIYVKKADIAQAKALVSQR